MYKCMEFSHFKFGRMEVILGEGNMLFSNNFLKQCLNVKNKELPNYIEIYDENDSWIKLFEVFEYIRYAKTEEENRYLFEEWIAEIIKDCSKLL